ncbi:hypothetical protein BBO99_00003737 [Phytophthora kernoviae]|uniref:Uncharacterized protein n=2 Tax=Phytophthora kernoviae TaxID=325452 RepID=A0A3R7GYH4_9STRA|nr:hypothetical protein G195_005596 [Phytophthora kernoviae 00238/432]KAG2524707.1 hypothetical protein JM16_004842 [Phytophthora kernoviae]KAG2526401.1 hypothetical protein JM18_004380 [Phytophthora kernoviae]RLM96197.1 hypothetical protein BBI17_003778 [Phytophthora kernoviae]RLN81418.1 hypothetical protein BBO99_00003737 [Phytophthora kernoviae]
MDLNTEAVATGWMYVPLSQETAQMALDAVRYRRNYVRGVTSRLCLHYINSIRKRIGTDSIVSYLYSVDGCVSSEIVASGRCDIYSCRPYTYEVQLAQKVVKSDVFIVQSIYKTFTQKTLIELQEDSNLDFSTAPQGIVGRLGMVGAIDKHMTNTWRCREVNVQ